MYRGASSGPNNAPGTAGQCLFCHQTGHVSGNCPNRGSNLPPSFSSMANSGRSATLSSEAASAAVQPIESLTPFIGNKWWIKARVTDKSPIRTWNNARSQGKLFSMTLVDNTGPIRATIFQDGVDRYYDQLVEGNIYLFSRGQVKTANKKFCSVNCEYELSFDKDAEIQPVRSNDPSTHAFPEKVYSFVPLHSLKTREVGCTVDILCVVTAVSDAVNFTSKNGNNLTKRTIGIADTSAAIDLTLWDQTASQWTKSPGTILAVRGARLTEFQGDFSLSLSGSSSVEYDPPCPDQLRIRQWYDKEKEKPTGLDIPNLSKGNNTSNSGGNGAGSSLIRNNLDDIARLNLGKAEKGDYVNLRLTTTYIKTENMFYDACPDCNKKLLPAGVDGSTWRCEKCDKMKDNSDPRYLVSLMVSDGIQSSWMTMFNDVAVKFFGVSAAEMKQAALTNPNATAKLCAPRVYFQFVGRVRVKEEKTLEGEDRMKLTLVGIRWLGPDAPAGESTSSFVTESSILLKEIEAYLSVK